MNAIALVGDDGNSVATGTMPNNLLLFENVLRRFLLSIQVFFPARPNILMKYFVVGLLICEWEGLVAAVLHLGTLILVEYAIDFQ